MNYIGIASLQDPQSHQAGDREREELMNYIGIASPARPTKPPRREDRDREELMNYIGIASPQDPQSHQAGERERERR